MTSTWKRFHIMYLNQSGAARILTPIVLLALIVIIFRWMVSGPYGTVWSASERIEHRMSETEIKSYINSLSDTRPSHCQMDQFGGLGEDTVTIVLDYYEEQFYDLKLTLNSIIENTPSHLYTDIIVLDDASDKDHIKHHAASYIGNNKFDKVKVYRSERTDGQSISRFKASKMAQGSILVFLNSDVVVNEGWLEPLIDSVRTHRHTLAVPHYDNLLSGYRFFKMEDNLINMFGWTLSTVYYETPGKDEKAIRTPVMRGEAFAVDKIYLDSIGNWDENMDNGPGHSLELSLRTWLCGGEIKIIPCSRIAVHSSLRPVPVESSRNIRRIAELWLGDYKYRAYAQSGVPYELPESEKQTLKTRKSQLGKITQCNDFDWYLKNVATDIILPSGEMKFFGKINSKSGYCITGVTEHTEEGVDMVLCRPYMYEPHLTFELNRFGAIKTGERCLSADDKGTLSFSYCSPGDGSQMWDYEANGQIRRRAGDQTLCLTHVTETTPRRDYRHNLALETCAEQRTQTWTFIKY